MHNWTINSASQGDNRMPFSLELQTSLNYVHPHSVIPHPEMDMVGIAIMLGVLCLRFKVQSYNQVGIFHETKSPNILDRLENIKECYEFETSFMKTLFLPFFHHLEEGE